MSVTGAVELWHSSCWSVRHARPVEEVTVVLDAPSPVTRRRAAVFDSGVVATVHRTARSARRATVAIAGLALVGAAGYGVTTVERTDSRSSLAAIQIDHSEAPDVRAALTERLAAPSLEEQYPIQSMHGTPLDELFPSLDAWVHPVVDSELLVSSRPTGMFGAERSGVERRECGDGHCGVDLGGPIGRPIVAVADGVVVHVERSESGRDGRSGRYVRIEHKDGALTAYMHMNTIRRGIDLGTRVSAGDQIGTLGATGVVSAAPHLHFSLEIPKVPGTHGDNVHTRYVDPAPFLVRATVTNTVDRRHPAKPAF